MLFAAMLLSAAPATAGIGLISYEGSDFSQDVNTSSAVRACDGESDSHGVHADFTTKGSGVVQQIRDGNGANNSCAYTGSYGDYKIYSHRAVEEINGAPDNFGDWKYPS
ncbi:hypothetical protein DQ237_04830 [Blastococcus sp. TF02-8]|nr:hypothetical protein DQ237_04830 [Blastococcus sp. TF02-8]